jgi:hypothetical protein
MIVSVVLLTTLAAYFGASYEIIVLCNKKGEMFL